MHAATRAGSVLFAPPPCAKGTATVKFLQWTILTEIMNVARKNGLNKCLIKRVYL